MANQMDTDPRSLADLLRDLRDESTALLRQEVALAKTEMTEKASKVGRNVAYLAVGALVGVVALYFVLGAVAAGISVAINDTDWSPHGVWIGPLIVGVIVAIVAMSMISKAQHSLTQVSLVPEKSIESLKEDKQWAQAKVQSTP